MFLYRVMRVIPLSKRASQIFLAPTNKATQFAYRAGQYVDVIHSDQSVSSLSMACAPKRNAAIEFHVFHPSTNLPAQDLLRMANEEKLWAMRGPFGQCTVDLLRYDMPIIFIARGTGLASVKAIMEELIKSSTIPPIHLYWSLPVAEDFYFKALIEEWGASIANFNFTPVFTESFSVATRANSQLLQDRILREHKNLANYQIYLSGSRLLASVTFFAFHPHGLQKERFYSDGF